MEVDDTRRAYEVSYLLRDEDASLVRTVVSKYEGEVVREASPQKVRLAYPIGDAGYAFLGSVVFRVLPATLGRMERDLCSAESVLRCVVTAPYVRRESMPRPFPQEEALPESGVQAPRRAAPDRTPAPTSPGVLTNEALEKKIEEILQ
jgi:ribosomal protein S6